MSEESVPRDVVERLQAEKREYEKELREAGHKDGYETAKEMSYPELAGLGHSTEGLDRRVDRAEIVRESSCYDDWLKESLESTAKDWHHFDEDIYLSSWLEGVTEFWLSVCSQL